MSASDKRPQASAASFQAFERFTSHRPFGLQFDWLPLCAVIVAPQEHFERRSLRRLASRSALLALIIW
jgi:hypothetical protein